MLTPLKNTNLELNGRTLFVIWSYGGRPPYSFTRKYPLLGFVGRLADRLTGYSLRQFIANNRDFAANPRTLEYQLGLVKDAIAWGKVSDFCCSIDSTLSYLPVVDEFKSLSQVEFHDPQSVNAMDIIGFDTVVFVYPDALGLGRSHIETKLMRSTKTPLVAVNGRRRIWQFDDKAKWRLRWRRFLANTRIVELGMTVLIVPVACAWAAWDSLRGKS